MGMLIWISKCFAEAIISLIAQRVLKICLRQIKAILKHRSS